MQRYKAEEVESNEELLKEARDILNSSANESEISLRETHLVCECMCVSISDIRELLKGKKVDLEILKQELKLGSGCSSCIKSFKDWKGHI